MSGDRLKVLVLADSRSFHTERYVAEMRRQGCRVLLLSLENGHVFHYDLRRRGPVRALHYPLAAREIRTIVRRFVPDIVNPHFASGYGFAAALIGHATPILLHVWGSDVLIVPHKSMLHCLKTKLALRRADAVIGDSDYLLREAGKIAELKEARTIAWGVEREYLSYHRDSYRMSRPLKIIVPRPHERVYNNTFVVGALAPLIQEDQIEVTFPGFGSLLPEFQQQARQLVGDKLKFYTKLPRPEFLRFVASHDLFLSAAVSDSSPVSLIEAMALGLIPVAADIPGVREWLSEDRGYRYGPSDPAGLREVISRIARSDDDHAAMRRRNLEKVKQQAVFEDNIAETIAIMRDLILRRRR